MNSSELTPTERANVEEANRRIASALTDFSTGGSSWMELYQEWKRAPENQLKGMLLNIDPFSDGNAGDSMDFDFSDKDCPTLVETVSMCLFLCQRFKAHEKETIAAVYNSKNAEEKKRILQEYFKFIEISLKTPGINQAIVYLNGEAERQSVYYSQYKYFDSYIQFDALRELLREETTEAIYLHYTLWRLTSDKQDFKELLGVIDSYLKHYFYDYDNDPDMHLTQSLAGLHISRKLELILHWAELVAFHTEGIFNEYKKRNWLSAADHLMDDFHITNQISLFAMLGVRTRNPDADRKTVQQKAICAHSYILWVKTADVYTILCDIYRILQKRPEAEIRRMGLTPTVVLNQFDFICKVRNRFISTIFYHSAFYENQRDMFNLSGILAEEKDASIIAESVDDMLEITSTITNDDIAGLMTAKQKYVQRVSTYLSVDQQAQLEEHMLQVAEKIKEKVSKLSSFDALYSAVSDDFLPYASLWVRHPQILYSLVSAEYLYQQYIENHEEISKFDYSCVSILYYLALEDFVNKLLYIPYLNDVLIPHADDIIKKDFQDFFLILNIMCGIPD